MPHESSAVADLVSLAHREPIHASPDPGDPRHGSGRSGLSGVWIVVIGLLVIGASVAGGYFMARQEAPGARAERAPAVERALIASEPPTNVPSTLGAADRVESDASEEEIEPESGADLAEVDIELAKVTGFDVLVQPSGAKVSLDGQAIGAAPLRVRNLLPGKHAIDIEGPDGYFGKHLEFDLQAGDAEVLKLVLQAVGDAPPVAAETEPTSGNSEEEEPEKTATETKQESKSVKTDGRRNGAKAKRDRRRVKASADEEKLLDKAEKVALGTLMLGAKPPCDIIINGKNTGLVTPQRAIQLPAGMHRVILVNKKLKVRKSFKVKIKSGLTTRAIQDLSSQL